MFSFLMMNAVLPACVDIWLRGFFPAAELIAQYLPRGSMQSLAMRKNINTSNTLTNNQNASKNANNDSKPSPSVVSDGSNVSATPSLKQSNDASSAQVDKFAFDKQFGLTITSSDMPDLGTTIKSSSSFLGSFAAASPTGRFDISRSRNISVTVSGVKSRRVDIDPLLDLVTLRRFSFSSTFTMNPPAWQPDILLPQLRWSPSTGQTLWIVVEIIYANKVSVEGGRTAELKGETEVKELGRAEGVNASLQGSVDRSGVWRVTAPGGNSTFPLACRLQRLDYDAYGNLVCVSNREMSRSQSYRHHLKPAKMQSSKASQRCVAPSLSQSRALD
ncbi:hypothetical protein KP509_17G010900 [Ceratopteris richardii]|uniref:Uncharacterized protein n=1 Tax=Ceratopteris richardii TaxID=49495 RepID=A0A8T2SSS4_CERRI|nr:hypothetical protein KP509_17G010900 [Ceratopteris richardii]